MNLSPPAPNLYPACHLNLALIQPHVSAEQKSSCIQLEIVGTSSLIHCDVHNRIYLPGLTPPRPDQQHLMLGKLSVSLTLTLEEIAGQGWLKCSLMGKPGEDTAWKLSLLCVCGSWSQGSGARERESLVFYPSPRRREETFQRMLRGLVMDWMWKLWFLARKPG